jgi:hypothetical protein
MEFDDDGRSGLRLLWTRSPARSGMHFAEEQGMWVVHDVLQLREDFTGDEVLSDRYHRIILEAMLLRRGR